MATMMEAGPSQHEDWLVFRAKSCLKSDPYAAKAWLITARTLYPRHFGIQFEAYNMEKVQRNTSEAAKQLEDMFATFGQEPELWKEVHALSASLQSTATDEHTEFLRALFGALPAALQCHLLQRIVDGTADVLEQCRLALLILRRYPDRGPEQGVKLMDSLLAAEKHAHSQSPVNCYRKYMVCDMLPLVLKAGVKDVPQKLVLRWLQKTIEFYVCYSTQADPEDSQLTPDMMSPTKKLSFSASGGRRVAIAGLPESDAYVEQPWQRLFDTVHLLAKPLGWDMENLLNNTSPELQLQRLQSLQLQLSSQPEGSGSHRQFLYCSTLLFFRSLNKYTLAVDPEHITGPGTSKQPPLVLTEGLKSIITTAHESRAKRHKTDQTAPSIHASPSIVQAKTLIQHFTTALKCSDLLNSTESVKKEFTKLCQHWKTDTWPWLRNFETDMLIYKGHFKEAMNQLQKSQPTTSPPSSQLRSNLQLASCHYNSGNYSKCCEILVTVIGSLPAVGESPLVELEPALRGRQLQLLTCSETEIIPYSIHLLITCFKEKAFRGTNPDDTAMGHMIVLLQYDWPRYEPLFAEVVTKIRRVGSFTYSIFFNYIVCIDMLEEFSYLRRPEGGKVTLDVLTVSTKTMAQQRTVTRGVNKGVKEDFKVSMEKQVARSGENIDVLIRQFLSEQCDNLQSDLL